jgi:hypothetical protein
MHEIGGVERMIDPVEFVVHVAADMHFAPLEHLHAAHQQRRVHAQAELRIARGVHHLRRAGHAHPAAAQIARRHPCTRIDDRAARAFDAMAITSPPELGERRQHQADQHQQRAADAKGHACRRCWPIIVHRARLTARARSSASTRRLRCRATARCSAA